MREFEFNTGVQRWQNPPVPLCGPYQQWRPAVGGGHVKVILFYADVPEDAVFMFACDNAELPEAKMPDVVVAPIEGGLLSKFGYFRVK